MSNSAEELENALSKMRSIEPEAFENFISDVWEFLGYNTKTTSPTGDKGIDIVASRQYPYDEKLLIQAKRYGSNSSVSGPEMQKYGRLTGKKGVDSVLVISTGGFTSQAREIADEENIKCIDGYDLAELVIREDIDEIIESYVSDHNIKPSNSKRSPETIHQEKQELNHLVGEGKFISIEVVGFDNKKFETNKQSAEKKKYTGIAMKVENKTSYQWRFRGSSRLSVNNADGFLHDKLQWCRTDLSPWHDAYTRKIHPHCKCRLLAVFKTWFEPQRVEYKDKLLQAHANKAKTNGYENITVHIDKSDRESIRGLPESLPTNIELEE